MPIEFVKQRVGSSDLAIAVRQQEQLSYFTESTIQEDLPSDYFDKYDNRNSTSSDGFLNYAKSVFRTDNYVTFAKYLRTPIISSELVDNRIRPDLERVFHSENSYFNYTIRGESFSSIDELDSAKFDKSLFNALLFNHNDIVVTVMQDVNKPKRQIIDIRNVVALDSSDSVIHQIAYSAIFNNQKGFMYMDAFQYAFYDEKFDLVLAVPHDLGETPADYISNEAFSKDSDIIRKSIFSKSIRRMEDYVFLDVMLKMTIPNGVIPVTTILETKIKEDRPDTKGQEKGEPMSAARVGGQSASIGKEITPSKNLSQAGTTIVVPVNKNTETGAVNMDMVKDFIHHHHMPIEPLKFIKERIGDQERSIVVSIVGDFSEGNESAMNELQVGKGYKSKEDRLRDVSIALTVIRKASDRKTLALQHGKDNVTVDLFFGSDFFTETQKELNELFQTAANPIEREDILIKSSMNKNRFNPDKQKRTALLYKLIPYAAQLDFDTANLRGLDNTTFQYQTRFSYWISQFESKFGSIVEFAQGIEREENERISIINLLIIDIINDNEQTDNSTT